MASIVIKCLHIMYIHHHVHSPRSLIFHRQHINSLGKNSAVRALSATAAQRTAPEAPPPRRLVRGECILYFFFFYAVVIVVAVFILILIVFCGSGFILCFFVRVVGVGSIIIFFSYFIFFICFPFLLIIVMYLVFSLSILLYSYS